jgi:hypothetical protein
MASLRFFFFLFCISISTSGFSQGFYAFSGYNGSMINKDAYKNSIFLSQQMNKFEYFDGFYMNFGLGGALALLDIEYAFKSKRMDSNFTDDNGALVYNQLKLTDNVFSILLGGVVGNEKGGIASGLKIDMETPKLKSRYYVEGEKKGNWERIALNNDRHFSIGPAFRFFIAKNGLSLSLTTYYMLGINSFKADEFGVSSYSFGFNLGAGVFAFE